MPPEAPGAVLELRPRPVAGSVEELLAGSTNRQRFFTSDSKSGSSFERVEIDGEPHIVKYVHVDDDWTMRGIGDVGCRPLRVWASGLMDACPEFIDHPVVGAAGGVGRNGWGAALLMRDVSSQLVPPGDDPLSLDDHLGFLDSLAAMAARMWGWIDDVDLVPFQARWQWFVEPSLEVERERGWPEPVPRIAVDGWERFGRLAPADAVELIFALRRDVSPLTDALRQTPQTFLHGDWKLGNLGRTPDGRTLLIDWTYPGAGPVAHDLSWYLSLNRARLPAGHSKDDAIEAFRISLERHGLSTAGWWDRQVDLCLLGALVQFGWEKALGPPDELQWWTDRARTGASRL